MPPSRPRRLEDAALLLWAAALTAIFCGPPAARMALWTDELFSWMTAAPDLPSVFGLLASYHPGYFDQPPLYFVILHGVMALGDSPLWLRLPSLVCVALAAGVMSVFFRRRGFSLAAAGALAAALVFHPELRFQAANARMYALLAALAAATPAILWHLPASRGRARLDLLAALAGLLAALVYTSYFGALYGLGVGAAGLAWAAAPRFWRVPGRRAGLGVLAACLVGAALVSPWAPVILKMLHAEAGEGDAANAGAAAAAATARWAELRAILHDLGGTSAGAFFLWPGWVFLMTHGRRRRRWAMLGLALGALPLALLVGLTPPGKEIRARYLIGAIPILVTGAAAGWGYLLRRLAGAGWRAEALLCLALLAPVPADALRARATFFAPVPDWWAAARLLQREAAPGDKILAGGWLSGQALLYHLVDPASFEGRLIKGSINNLDLFKRYCADPAVDWFVNVQPMTPAFTAMVRSYFPYRVAFAGNRGVGEIQIFAKRPITSHAN